MNIVRAITGLFHFDRTNWKAVSLCVLAATVFWIFNAFNKNHTTTLQFPLTFEYNHERFVPVKELPQKISINVTGNGWDLFTKYFGFKLPHLVIPVERPSETRKIVGTALTPKLASQLSNLQINHILTDTLQFQFDLRDKHSYRLAADLSKVTYEKGYGRVSRIVILPDSVSLEGPQSLLHQLSEPIHLEVNADRVNSNFKSEVEIEIKGKDFIQRNPPTAKVIFEVGRVTDIQKRIPVATRKKSKSKDSVNVWFQIPVDKIAMFETERKEITATKRKSRIDLSHLPSYAIVLKTDSIQ